MAFKNGGNSDAKLYLSSVKAWGAGAESKANYDERIRPQRKKSNRFKRTKPRLGQVVRCNENELAAALNRRSDLCLKRI